MNGAILFHQLSNVVDNVNPELAHCSW